MSDEAPRIITPNVTATSAEVQRAIGDALTKCTSDLMAKYNLEPLQIIKGLFAFLWDFNRLLGHRPTQEMAKHALWSWNEMDQRSGFKG